MSVSRRGNSACSSSPSSESSRDHARHCGFTLIEVLMVIGIIGLLISLLFPAVQAAREAARRTECQNHLKQIGLAMQGHESSYRRLPTNGWGWRWVGDPDRGTDRRQPGGWIYNILPYLEQQPLRQLGQGKSPADKRADLATLIQTPLSMFSCPTRRSGLLPHSPLYIPFNSDPVTEGAKCDYAVCEGDTITDTPHQRWKRATTQDTSGPIPAKPPAFATCAAKSASRRSATGPATPTWSARSTSTRTTI